MIWTIVLFVVGIIALFFCAAEASDGKVGSAWFWGLMTIFLSATNIFTIAPLNLGVGRVSRLVEKYEQTLDNGVSYQTAFTVKDDNTQVLLLRKDGTSVFRAIRVEGTTPPPEHFTLVNGQPAAITPPVATTPLPK